MGSPGLQPIVGEGQVFNQQREKPSYFVVILLSLRREHTFGGIGAETSLFFIGGGGHAQGEKVQHVVYGDVVQMGCDHDLKI